MTMLNLSKVGNIRRAYRPTIYEAIPQGVLVSRDLDLMLKAYNMIPLRESRETPAGDFRKQKEALLEEINSGKLKRHSGLGWAVFSEGVTNVSVWGKDEPDVHMQTLYVPSANEWVKADVGTQGTFCNGEGGIYCFERFHWKGFLNSKRTNADKEKYLSAFLNGIIL